MLSSIRVLPRLDTPCLGYVRALVTGSPLQSADPSPLLSGILSIPPFTLDRTLLPVFLLSLTSVYIGFISTHCPHSRTLSSSLWDACYEILLLAASLILLYLFVSTRGKKRERERKKWRGASAILLGFPSTFRFKGCSHSNLFHSHSCPSPVSCPFFYLSHQSLLLSFLGGIWGLAPEEILGHT